MTEREANQRVLNMHAAMQSMREAIDKYGPGENDWREKQYAKLHGLWQEAMRAHAKVAYGGDMDDQRRQRGYAGYSGKRKGWPTTAKGAARHLDAMVVKRVALMLRDFGVTSNSGACARALVRKGKDERDVLKAAQWGEFAFRRFLQLHCGTGRTVARLGRDMPKRRRRRRTSRDMGSELRKYSLQALGRMLRQALNQGDEHKARLIEQEIDRRSRRR